jgi:polar amino acid transport system substrate-binding protein
MVFMILFATLPALFIAMWPTQFPVTQYNPDAPAAASTPADPQPLRVITRVVEPFVTDEGNGAYGGYSLELLDLIRGELIAPKDSTIDYNLTAEQKAVIRKPLTILSQKAPNANALVDVIDKAEDADLGIASISITQDRERRVDFTLPIYSSALQVMQTTEKAPGPRVRTAIAHILSDGHTQLTLILGLLGMFVLANFIYFFERRHIKSFLYGEPYGPGVANAFWWGLTALVGQEESHPKSALSRVAALGLIATGVVAVSLFTASIASDLTLQRIDDPTRGLDSLDGQRVVTVTGTTSETFLESKKGQLGIRSVKMVPNLETAYDELRNKTSDALVYDAPVLQYFAEHKGRNTFTTVGRAFHTEYYGIVLPRGSTWREPISRAILTLSEDGRLDALAKTRLGRDRIDSAAK